MQEDYKTMEEACRKAIELDSQKPLAYYFAAKAAIGLHNDFMAIAMLTKAILLKEDYTEAYQLRAETLWNMRQVKEAGEDIQVLLRMNPNDEQALLLDAEIQAATGNTDQAIGQLQQILSLNPFQEKAYFLLGELYLSLKETEKAIAVYDEAIDINPNFAQAYQERGRIKLLNGDKEGSVADMKKALELAPETEEKINGQYNNFTDK
jgi:tetratricopeptide (TPR) repeat protein